MPRPIILNEVAARKFFQDQDPLDQLMGSSPMDAVNGQMRVVGVVADAHYNSLRDEAPPTLYEPLTPNNARLMALNVRTIGDPLAVVGALRAAVSEVDPDLPLQRVQTQLQAIDGRVAEERVFARAGLLFGGLALLMASVGLYGLMSYGVARRTHEIGIRMALGAGRNTVVRMIMGESLGLVLAGVGLGIVGAAVATRLIAGQLFGVATLDPVSFVGAVVVLVAVSALAGYWPARRASRVDPSAALQHE